MTLIINQEALEKIISGLNNFVWTEENFQERERLRQNFISYYNKDKINNLTKEEYFAGMGLKEGCMAYDLEWTTKDLGSIKGGSKYKFGYESDFPKIKSLLSKIISVNSKKFYNDDGTYSEHLAEIVEFSKEIRGFKTGRTVIPKLLSIYYPEVFLPIFNDQEHFLSKLLLGDFESGSTGVELYLDYNFKLLKVKDELENITGKNFSNYEFSNLLYYIFPKEQINVDTRTPIRKEETADENFEALEVQHYQSLLHRNFNRLFPNFRYFDEEEQIPKNGQYDTQVVGIMDFLTVDAEGNFVVIEIKRQATDKTLGQILRYMGWVQEELCKEGQKVTGIIIGEKKDTQLDFALKAVPNVKFIKLELSITLREQ